MAYKNPGEAKDRDSLPIHARKVVKKCKNLKVSGKKYIDKDRRTRYSKEMFFSIYQGYDAFQYLFVVRRYIQRKYKVDLQLLELMLWLAPFEFFAHKDYIMLPKNLRYSKINWMVEKGYLAEVGAPIANSPEPRLYKISTRMRHMVTSFYKLMAGEEKMSLSRGVNPFYGAKTGVDKKRMDVIKLLTERVPSETQKGLYS